LLDERWYCCEERAKHHGDYFLSHPVVSRAATLATRAVNQLIDYQLIAILIDYFNYQFNYLKATSISISISSCHWRPIELSTN
jgi:hypothetical protein